MNRDFTIFCGETIGQNPKSDQTVFMNIWGSSDQQNINLHIDDLHEAFWKDVPSQFHDLVEIATYVYCTDQKVKRIGQDVDSFGGNWRRNFHFHIPVRAISVWQRTEIREALIEVLNFLSDDHYEFSFHPAIKPPAFQQYLSLKEHAVDPNPPQQVMMFSGGLDSLAGAVDEVINDKRKVMLVTHASTPKNNKIIRNLLKQFSEKAGKAYSPFQVSVRASNKGNEPKDYTQRTRSFLFASLGVAVAKILNLSNLRFYENGIISLNLPICAQVVGSKATRTTHPQVLAGFERLFSLLGESDFKIENPYLWKTKAEVIQVLVKSGHPDLIKSSISCAHTWERCREHTHCGTCSQCLDRRIAMLSAGAEEYDPSSSYKHNIFEGYRPKDDDKVITAAYLERANQIGKIKNATDFMILYPEIMRAVRFIPGTSHGNLDKLYQLYKRHAHDVNRAMDRLLTLYVSTIRERKLPSDSLVTTIHQSASIISMPAVTEGLPLNYFWQTGNMWEARFNGGRKVQIQRHRKGCQILHYLLARPWQRLSVYSVAAVLNLYDIEEISEIKIDQEELQDGYQITEGPLRGDLGATLDEKAVFEYRKKARDLKEELEEANLLGNTERSEDIKDQIAQIHNAINGSEGKAGKKRKQKDLRKNLVDAYRINVTRTINEIAKTAPKFSEHLKDFVTCGSELSYLPDIETVWSVFQNVRHDG